MLKQFAHPMETAAAAELCVEMEHSCSERVTDDRAPATASSGLWAPIPELLPQSCKGGQGQGGVQGSQGPTSWGRVTSELSCSLSEGREGSQCFQSCLLCFIAAAFSKLLWLKELWGVADNGCSHFPAVRYLMTLTPNLPFFLLIYFFPLA